MGSSNASDSGLPEHKRQPMKLELMRTMLIMKAENHRRRRFLKIGVATAVVLCSTAGAFYIATQSVTDRRSVQCLYSLDLDEQNTMYSAHLPEQGEEVDPVALCASHWRSGVLTPYGLNSELRDPNSSFDPNASSRSNGVPPLTACVRDGMVVVLPAGPGICAKLGIPALEP